MPTRHRTWQRRWTRLRGAAVRAVRGTRWFVRELTGASAYDKYVVRHTLLHPGEPPLAPRQFWRQRADAAEQAPIARCC